MVGKVVLLFVLVGMVERGWGHGMMMDPPNRSSMWRFDHTSPPNYDDNQNFCGGMSVQWQINNGKCGICGDDYRVPQPRPNENTGTYGLGKIAKVYKAGSDIEVSILLTANHKGSFYFSICNLLDHTKPETDECFKALKLTNGQDMYVVPSTEKGYYKVNLKLPEGLTCSQCVLRWHYRTGNTWGKCDDGTSKVGCGPQETFRSCSDIGIE